jgi:DNA-binding protein YbaB
MAELPKEMQDQIHKTVKELSQREFYKGISCGKVVIANMIKAKLEDISVDSDKETLLERFYEILKFCDITSRITPEIEISISKKLNK